MDEQKLTAFEPGSFPLEVQYAIYLHDKLPAMLAEMSGMYLGKDLSRVFPFFDLYEIRNRKTVFGFIDFINSLVVSEAEKKAEKARKKHEREHGTGKKFPRHTRKG